MELSVASCRTVSGYHFLGERSDHDDSGFHHVEAVPRVSELMALLEVVDEVVTRLELMLAIDPGKSSGPFGL